MNKYQFKIRLLCYLGGFLIMTFGIAFSVKSNLGVSPVSSIPYTMTCVWGIEMGKATILFHAGLVLLQILLLRKHFKMHNLLQILIGIVFGYFTTLCNFVVGFFPTPHSLIIRLFMSWISTVLVAFGIFLYVPANFVPLAGEGTMLAIADISGKPFPKVKVMFDITMVCVSLITCLSFGKGFGSVGVGTVIAAMLVGLELNIIYHFLGKYRDMILVADNL